MIYYISIRLLSDLFWSIRMSGLAHEHYERTVEVAWEYTAPCSPNIVRNVSYEVACDKLNLSTLAERRLNICSRLFRQITRECHVLHSAKRDAEIAGRLRLTKKYHTVRARTSRYKNSFIPYTFSKFQWHFHSCMHCLFLLYECLSCTHPASWLSESNKCYVC